MQQILMGILLILGIACWWLYSENQTLSMNNMQLEIAVAEQEEAIKVIKESYENQGKALNQLASKNAQIEAEMNGYLDIFRRHNLNKLAIAKPGMIETRANDQTQSVFEAYRDPAARVRMVEHFASPALKVSIDTGHAAYAHGIGNAPAVDRYVRAAGDQLAHVHLQDTDHFADRHWPIGDGDLPWSAIFSELGKLSSKPRLIIEIKDKSAIKRSRDWLADRGLGQ